MYIFGWVSAQNLENYSFNRVRLFIHVIVLGPCASLKYDSSIAYPLAFVKGSDEKSSLPDKR
jgi:hypothetical protein